MTGQLLEYAIYIALLVVLAIPLSAHIDKVIKGERTPLSFALEPVERAVYKAIGIDAAESMGWKHYLLCAFAFSAVSFAGLVAVLLLQGHLPFNPEGADGMSWDLAFNTAASFVTNTNWQAYSGESALSYFSQAIGLTVQNFVTPAVGLGVLFVLFRGVTNERESGIGSFWVDVTRSVLYILMPLCLVITLVNVSQGSPQNFSGYETVNLLEPIAADADGNTVPLNDPAAVNIIDKAVVPLGPQASQVSIKQLGTNGGGYNGANSASPLENPTPLSNLVQCVSILLIPIALTLCFGRFVRDRRQGWAVLTTMLILLIVGVAIVGMSEMDATPQLAADGSVLMSSDGQSGGNMEGKESRFGVADSSIWAAFTTAASNGSVNSMHDSFTPIGGMVPIIFMGLGEVVGGGVGCGLYSFLGFVILTVFIAGLMVGRTPEYLGKKIGPHEMRMAAILCITTPVAVLIGSSMLCVDPSTMASLHNTGSHGFSEMLYAATSAGGNNGSAFAGFNANTPFINIVLGLEMLANRFVPIAATCCLAGSLCTRPRVAVSSGTLSTSNAQFVFLVILIILLVGALSLFPALALGPIAEQLQMAC